MNQALFKKCMAVFSGTFALVFIGTGANDNLGTVSGGLPGIWSASGLVITGTVYTDGIFDSVLKPIHTFGLRKDASD